MVDRTDNLRTRFNDWRKSNEAQTGNDDSNEINNLCSEATQLLGQGFSPSVVRLADEIFGYGGDPGLELRVQLHRKYSKQATKKEEIFWSWWHLVDSLALLKRCEEEVEEQSKLYQWACDNMASNYILETLNDTTQGSCWIATGRFEDWAVLFKNAEKRLDDPVLTIRDKCLFLRTGAEMYPRVDQPLTAYNYVLKLDEINQEDPGWDEYLVFWSSVITSKLVIFSKQGRLLDYEDTVHEALTFLDEKFKKLPGDQHELLKICRIAHDIGTILLYGKRYDQAKSLLEFAAQHHGYGFTHMFLATCIWILEKDRAKVLQHIKQAQLTTKGNWNLRGRYRNHFLETEEFADVHDDPEFLSIFN